MAAKQVADRDETVGAFHEAVNMTAGQLEKWLATDASRGVGQSDGGESVGHASGRRIVELLHTKKADLTDDDLAHMRKVVGYVHRHVEQRPGGDVTDTRWRYSLMNWGHDPEK
ncbi:DUF3140 domain-containing protein [Streptomyces sp. NPDC005476]|uniref:DUF3140 domain-containing protein n=1 Tax=Streptomyces sp. NPDC005476 TaxID=3156882 RepID=UPI00345560DF